VPDAGLSQESTDFIRQRTESEVTSGLLAYLRTALRDDRLSFAEPPARITGGFDTLIYGFQLNGAPEELSGPLILRIFRENPKVPVGGQKRARFEAAVHSAVVGLGYPAPRVLRVSATTVNLAGAFLIMERLPGRIMLESFFKPSPLLFRLHSILANSQVRLHALDPEPLLRAIEAEGFSRGMVNFEEKWNQIQRHIDRLSLEGLQPGLRWLEAHRPAEPEDKVICHGDFHPLNILMVGRVVSGVIDWPNVTIADPAYDVGATLALFGQGPLDLPDFLQKIVAALRRLMLWGYFRAYQRQRHLNPKAVRYYEALRLLGFLTESSEHRLADAGIIERPAKPTAFAAPHVIKGIISRFRQITGTTLTVPPPIPAIKRAARKE